jgi:hypothetical protein
MLLSCLIALFITFNIIINGGKKGIFGKVILSNFNRNASKISQ